MSKIKLIVEADGGSRGNPGVAAGGAVVINATSGEVIAERGRFIGVATNNVAEYNGLICGLERAIELDPDAEISVRMDSKLVIEQMSGRWKIKHPDMQSLAEQARTLIKDKQVEFSWIARAKNSRADRAANRSMDLKNDFDE